MVIMIGIWKDPMTGTVSLVIKDINHQDIKNSKIAKPMKLEWEKYYGGTLVKEPTLQFDEFEGSQFLTELSNALIESGYRDKVVSKDGEIERLESHLKDMRKITFHKLNIKGDD